MPPPPSSLTPPDVIDILHNVEVVLRGIEFKAKKPTENTHVHTQEVASEKLLLGSPKTKETLILTDEQRKHGRLVSSNYIYISLVSLAIHSAKFSNLPSFDRSFLPVDMRDLLESLPKSERSARFSQEKF